MSWVNSFGVVLCKMAQGLVHCWSKLWTAKWRKKPVCRIAGDASDIPCDIFRKILLLLPAKSLIRFRAVSKDWQSIIDDPCFVKAHTQKQQSLNTILIRNSTGSPYFPLYSVDLGTLNSTNGIHSISATPFNFSTDGLSRLPQLPVATCNGLMLIAPQKSEEQNWWEIWNPLTHERLELPRRGLPTTSHVSHSGIGYDYATDDYKAVLIFHRKKRVYETHVYSLKLDSWKRIKNLPGGDYWNSSRDGVFFSGSLHWISSNKIIALHMGTENYRQLNLPPIHERDRPEMMMREQQLEVLGGRLILFDYGEDDWLSVHYDVWAMNDYGADESWTRLFDVEEYTFRGLSSLRPIAYMKSKMQVLLHGNCSGLCIFDIESKYSGKSVGIHGLNVRLSAQVFHETIFRLQDNCGVVNGSVVPAERRIIQKEKMKISNDTKLMFCIRDGSGYHSHDSCFGIDSNWCCSSTEDED